MSSSNTNEAQALKEKGNAFYKSGELLKAIEQYKLACATDPTQPLLLFNLSAAQFETGQYVDSLLSTTSAIERCNPRSDGELLAKLWLRRAKCELHRRNFKDAEAAANKVPEFKPSEAIKKDAVQLGKAAVVAEFYYGLMLEEEILGMTLETPKYRPSLRPETSEYYNLGHDSAQSQFEVSEFPAGNHSTYSFFFGGIGDARHLYATLIAISQNREKKKDTNKYHFTINDIKPHTLARDFLIFLLTQQLSKIPNVPSDRQKTMRSDILALLFYIYVGVLFPPRVHSHFQRLIVTARKAIADHNEDFPPWLWISERDSLKINDVYDTWTEELFPANHAQGKISEAGGRMPPGRPPRGCEKEFAAYRKTGALFPPKEIRKHEPKMEALLASTSVGAAWEKEVKTYVKDHWKINMTLVDRGWCKKAGVWDVSFDPFSIAEKFYGKVEIPQPKEPTQVYDYFEPFFVHTAKAFGQLAKDIKVECNIDDCMAALEEIRYASKILAKDVARPEEFPIMYDRIHLSNIPDYVGGHMSTFLYALPVLKQEPHANVTSTCLVNPPLWDSPEAYIAEYLCLSSLSKLQSATCMKLCPGQYEVLSEFMPMCEYISWQHSGAKIPLEYNQLLPRVQFTRWLMQVFFKIAIPPTREVQSIARIFSPLNLSVFVRLLVRLVEIGYPAHWISSIVEDILYDRVTTTVRPLEEAPARNPTLEKQHPAKHVSTAPFRAEMEVLLCTWMRLLPFGIVSPPHIPRPEKIFEYRFSIASPMVRDEFVSVLALVFYPESLLAKFLATTHSGGGRKPSFRSMLAGTGTKTPEGKRLREKVIVVSTFGWDAEDREVTVKMKEGWIEDQRREERWVVGLWRTDEWIMCSAPTSLRGGNLKKRVVMWIDPTIGISSDEDEDEDE